MICKAKPIELIPKQSTQEFDPGTCSPRGLSAGTCLDTAKRTPQFGSRVLLVRSEPTCGTKRGGGDSTERLLTAEEVEILVSLARGGDRSAWEILASSFYPSVHRYLTRHLGDRVEAEDATQEVFLQAIRHIGELRIGRLFPAWIKVIARRTLHRYRGRLHGQKPAPGRNWTWENAGISARTPTPPELLQQKELVREVRSAVAALRTLDQDTLLAHYFRGESLSEISTRLGCPLGTVKRRLHTARRRLAEQLEGLVFA